MVVHMMIYNGNNTMIFVDGAVSMKASLMNEFYIRVANLKPCPSDTFYVF